MANDERRVRVRFAPSPTGPLHIGGVRTALYNYLFAKKHGGDLLLRIEDTDSNRFVPGAEDYIIESFRWLGIRFDEGVGIGGENGPYRQSERRDIYREYVRQLLESGNGYVAFDTPEELEKLRSEIPNFQYDASTRHLGKNSFTLSAEEVRARIDAGEKYVVRAKIEPNEVITVDDMVRGEVSINSNILDDKVLYKSADDLPTYHLANIVDDHLMGITHVIRGEEWLPSAPLHVLLYRYFGWEETMPKFAHLPLLLKPVGNGKLSKRDGDKLGFPVFPLRWTDPKSGEVSMGYRESGYLPEAVVNFLALLGWNPGLDRDLFTMEELIEHFDLGKVSKSGAKFDFEKAKWFNHEYVMRMSDEELAKAFAPILLEKGYAAEQKRLERMIGLVKSRITFVSDLWNELNYFFEAPTEYDEKSLKKHWKEDSPANMNELINILSGIADFTSKNMEEVVMGWIEKGEKKTGPVMNSFRIAVVGMARGPHMFDIAEIMGKEEIIKRIRAAVAVIK